MRVWLEPGGRLLGAVSESDQGSRQTAKNLAGVEWLSVKVIDTYPDVEVVEHTPYLVGVGTRNNVCNQSLLVSAVQIECKTPVGKATGTAWVHIEGTADRRVAVGVLANLGL